MIKQQEPQNLKINNMTKLVAIDFLSGTIGGVLRVLVGQPFDTIKVRMQQSSKTYQISHSLANSIKQEGFFSLFKGMSTPLLGLPFLTALNFTAYGFFKNLLNTKEYKKVQDLDEKIKLIQIGYNRENLSKFFIAGGLSGLVQSPFINSIDICKCLVQANKSKNKLNSNTFQIDPKIGAIGVGKQIIKNLGFKYLFRGIQATICRDSIGYAIYFTSYEFIKSQYLKKFATKENFNTQDKTSSLLAGMISGMVSWSAIYPIDVLKTRVQIDIQAKQYKGILDCFQQSLLQEGNIKFLYKGYFVTIIRAGPVAACSFTGYEMALKQLSKLNNTH